MPSPAADLLLACDTAGACPIHLVTPGTWPGVQRGLAPQARAYAEAVGFEPSPGRVVICPDDAGKIACILAGSVPAGSREADPFEPGALATMLPPGQYRFATAPDRPDLAALGWALSAYRFDRYRSARPVAAQLVVPEGVDATVLARVADAMARGRDLVNTPANDLGPEDLAGAAVAFARETGGQARVVVGDDLLSDGFPMVHAVGRASVRAPRLVDITWAGASADAPAVTLVGKGVVFDTGGLNLKPDSNMLLMKKDMGGAAAALTTARLLLLRHAPVRLRLILAIVENSVSGAAFRPGDVLASRKGLTVEIGNTDAEGRLILADALALADEEAPDLVVDFATLTGAARVALGPDLPPFYTDDEDLARAIADQSRAVHDPAWRLPLWPAYESMLASKIADVNHVSSGAFAGSITAALFLRRFVTCAKAHVHVDIFAWNPTTRPGRPEGGEVQAARLMAEVIAQRYG